VHLIERELAQRDKTLAAAYIAAILDEIQRVLRLVSYL